KCILKHRPPKPYRHPILDTRLTRHRILSEARTLVRCRRENVPVPGVLALDADNGWMMMEFVEGGTVKEKLQKLRERWKGVKTEGKLRERREREVEGLMVRVGEAVGRMHDVGIVHGDLTTSNLMLRSSREGGESSTSTNGVRGEGAGNLEEEEVNMDGEIVLIDFGLATQSSQDEDKAVDLYVLERAFGSTHPEVEEGFQEVLTAYGESYKGAKVVLKRLEELPQSALRQDVGAVVMCQELNAFLLGQFHHRLRYYASISHIDLIHCWSIGRPRQELFQLFASKFGDSCLRSDTLRLQHLNCLPNVKYCIEEFGFSGLDLNSSNRILEMPPPITDCRLREEKKLDGNVILGPLLSQPRGFMVVRRNRLVGRGCLIFDVLGFSDRLRPPFTKDIKLPDPPLATRESGEQFVSHHALNPRLILSFPQQRLAKWFTTLSPKDKAKIIKDVSQLVLSRRTRMCNFLEYKDTKVVYRRYASLFFIAGCSSTDNELITLEIVHRYVEQMDKYYGNVCELDIIFNFQKAYFILDELLLAGEMQESSKKNVLRCISQQDSLEDMEEQAVTITKLNEMGFT
ncbi:MAG: hypothetical protein Q9172_007699, partial [Xanthocarpia lactea]